MSKIQILYGIDYNCYVGGGSPMRKLGRPLSSNREVFFYRDRYAK